MGKDIKLNAGGIEHSPDGLSSELGASERRFRAMMEQSPQPIHIFAPDGTSISSNIAWDRLWGVEDDPPEGTNIFADRYLQQTGLLPYIRQSLREGAPVYSPALAYVHAGMEGAPDTTAPGTERDTGWDGEPGTLARGESVASVSGELGSSSSPWLEAYIYPTISESGGIEDVVLVLADVTEREHAHRELEYRATHDPLTGLTNRAAFLDSLGEALLRPEAGGSITVLFLDVDGLKAINDTLGHQMGDLLLQAVGDWLESTLRSTDVVARLGGDEFAVMLGSFDCYTSAQITKEAEAIASRLIHGLHSPFEIAGREIYASLSVGLATSTTGPLHPGMPHILNGVSVDGETSGRARSRARSRVQNRAQKEEGAERLLGKADLALHQAKASAKGTYEFYDEELAASVRESIELENDLRGVLRKDDPWDGLFLCYQPLVETKGRSRVSYEALLRWQHPDKGLLSPGSFLDIAEQSGLIVELGRKVLFKALSSFDSPGSVPGAELCVNLSAKQLRDPGLVADVEWALEESGFDPRRLVLELTESVLLLDQTIPKLEELRELGVRIAVDDFGTGYSSLSYLKDLPVDRLKVDRSFVANLGTGSDTDSHIVSAILELARAFGLEVVAEGVETETQLASLQELGCDLVQGFYLGRPEPA